ncbi:hypothetical protein V8C86DRAFT_2971215, partial [Haematococcus lacustris]
MAPAAVIAGCQADCQVLGAGPHDAVCPRYQTPGQLPGPGVGGGPPYACRAAAACPLMGQLPGPGVGGGPLYAAGVAAACLLMGQLPGPGVGGGPPYACRAAAACPLMGQLPGPGVGGGPPYACGGAAACPLMGQLPGPGVGGGPPYAGGSAAACPLIGQLPGPGVGGKATLEVHEVVRLQDGSHVILRDLDPEGKRCADAENLRCTSPHPWTCGTLHKALGRLQGTLAALPTCCKGAQYHAQNLGILHVALIQ